MARHDAQLRVSPPTLAALAAGAPSLIKGEGGAPLADILSSAGAVIRPLFGLTEDRLVAMARVPSASPAKEVPNLSVYYKVEASTEQMGDLIGQLREADAVEAAYLKPPAEVSRLNDMSPAVAPAPTVTPNFVSRQRYLGPAPGGIDAQFAWTRLGGRGEDVQIIDIEGAWRFTHEDLLGNQGGVVGGVPPNDLGWRNHGTAVVGVFGGDANGMGITGICPEANVRAISIFGGKGSAAAIRAAADMLRPGDIILIELHRPGPTVGFQNNPAQQGYIAVEWWPDDFDAIRYATSRGVIVVEAAGNGGENLDDTIFDVNPASPNGPFPANWKNPYRRSPLDSGAILVGAGAPPPGTHNRNHGPDRSRLGFSNYGALIDAQGWGREVTTCGYGDLQGGASEDLWYTDQFSGTSSASPIVVGALGSLQGVRRAAGLAPLTPAEVRALLRATGSPQQDAPAVNGPRLGPPQSASAIGLIYAK